MKITKYQKQVDKVHYLSDGYVDSKRWGSYFHQIDLARSVGKLMSKKKLKILEIGVGNGVVKGFLQNMFGHKVITMDVASDLNPDILCALPEVPKNEVFDLVICCEVLEHIEYSDAVNSLKNLSKITRFLIVSVPDKSLYISIGVKIPLFETFGFVFTFPFNRMPHEFKGEHYWEIGAFGISSHKFKRQMKESSFEVLKDYRVPLHPWHHFYLLKTTYEK